MSTVNFPNSPSNGQTLTTNTGITYTYNSAKSRWDATTGYVTASALDNYVQVANTASFATTGQLDNYLQVANSSSGVTAYSAISDLPLSGQETGKLAYVSGTNRLYLWAGSGWYNIALVNTDPSISGASASYTLNTDGSNTVVTLASTDPEGIPISFSLSTSGLGVGANAIATVTQSNNIFTFTPTTNTALAGTFTATFTASDGVNLAVANSSFTLSFTVTNSKYTTALVTSVGTNGSFNNSFVDSSTNSHTVTKSGNATQNTFSPYRHGGYSVYCDGNDAVKFNETGSDEFTFGTGDFTLEGWFYIDLDSIASGGEHTLIGNNGTDYELWFSVIGSNWGGPKYNLQTGTGSSWTNTVSSGSNTVTLKEWVHLAVVRSSGTVTIYENGVSVASGSNSVNIPNNNNMLSFMGRPQTYGQYTTGYIHDVRITKGEAVYTSAFTPPTEKLAEGSNTKLLAFRKPYITDESSSSLSVTLDTGDPTTEPFTPYDYGAYSSSNHGGSMYFDGTGDYLSIANDTSLTIGTGDFTAEAWIYVEAGASLNPYWRSFFALQGDGNANAGSISLYMDDGGDGYPAGSPAAIFNGNSYRLQSSADVRGRWTHVALARESGTMRFFVNGALASSASDSTNYNATNPTLIGLSNLAQSNYWLGHVADARFVKGTAVYTSAFTPPTAPLTAITNTQLLLSGTNAGIIDKSQSAKQLTLTADVQSSNLQTNLNTTSILFDGTSDKIEIPDFQLLRDGRDFTIEFWIYLANTSAERNILETFSFSATSGWTIYHLSGGRLDFYPHHTNLTTLSATTWTHIAIENYGGTIKCFVNGTSTYSATHSNTSTPTAGLRIGTRSGTGNYFIGYMEDIRITDGYARYQGSNFTAPTAPFEA